MSLAALLSALKSDVPSVLNVEIDPNSQMSPSSVKGSNTAQMALLLH